ncbi:hypothetical protein [Kineococcus indalonis]|uniref:hypothetical protein n=1 Tax=Kineococcus indalonis TaxID=2696566 RepID=UPI001413269C|nr:hypothetical protein [Kineococcus indalonis]NAZ86961.1 hypothetical protein [Kineococcus indalonis]
MPGGDTGGDTGGEGGEAVCWLERVCPGCGALREGREDAPCAACGAPPGATD